MGQLTRQTTNPTNQQLPEVCRQGKTPDKFLVHIVGYICSFLGLFLSICIKLSIASLFGRLFFAFM